MLPGLPGQPPQVIQAALVGLHRDGPAAVLGHLADHLPRSGLVLQIAEHHRGPVSRQPFDDRPAYPP